MFDETIKITEDGRIEGLDISLYDVAKLCEGRDEDGIPRSFGLISINAVNGDQTEKLYEFQLMDAAYSIYLSGGCVVVTAELDASNTGEINDMMEAISPYIALRQYNPGDDVLTLSLVPLHFSGNMFFVFMGAAFVRAYRKDESTWEIVMAFDNGITCPVIAEDIDLREEADYVQAELAEMNRIEEAKLAKLEAEIKKLENEAMYQRIYGHDEEDDVEETESKHPGIRIAKEDE